MPLARVLRPYGSLLERVRFPPTADRWQKWGARAQHASHRYDISDPYQPPLVSCNGYAPDLWTERASQNRALRAAAPITV